MNILKNNLSKNLSLIIILFINFIFTYKYSHRVVTLELSYLISIIHSFLLIFIIQFYYKNFNKEFSKKIFLIIIAAILFLWMLILNKINPTSIKVDRFEMIQNFWLQIQDCIYPYVPRNSINIPGPFPVYFLIFLPFYFIGEIGLAPLFIFILFMINNRIKYSPNTTPVLAIAVLFSISTGFWWEAACRSTLLMNIFLLIIFLEFINKIRLDNLKQIILTSLFTGLLLSTRSIIIFPLIIFFIFRYRNNLNNKMNHKANLIKIGIYSIIIFLLTFVPLYLWKPDEFFVYNPLLVQNTLLSLEFSFVILFISIIFGFYSNNMTMTYFFSGLIIFLAVLISFINSILKFGLENIITQSYFDISYFLLSVPFFYIFIIDYPISKSQQRF